MASERWTQLFDSLQGGVSTEAVVGHTEMLTLLYDKERFLFTGTRIVPKDSPEIAPRNERTGRWDKATGRIVWDNETTEQSAVVGPAVPRTRKVLSEPTTPKEQDQANETAPKAEKPREPQPNQNRRPPFPPYVPPAFNPETDPRRGEVIRLRLEEDLSCLEIGRRVKMAQNNVSRILATANLNKRIPGKSGFQRGHLNANHTLTPAQVLEILNATGSAKAVGARYGVDRSTVQRIRRGELWSSVTGLTPKDPEWRLGKAKRAHREAGD